MKRKFNGQRKSVRYTKEELRLIAEKVIEVYKMGLGKNTWNRIALEVEKMLPKAFEGRLGKNRAQTFKDTLYQNKLYAEVVKELEDETGVVYPITLLHHTKTIDQKRSAMEALALHNQVQITVDPAVNEFLIEGESPVIKRPATMGQVNDEDSYEEKEEEVHSNDPVLFVDGVAVYDEELISRKNKKGSVEFEKEFVFDHKVNSKKMTPKFLLELFGLDPEMWTLVNYSQRKGSWNAQKKGGKIITLYSQRMNITARPKVFGDITPEEMISLAQDAAKSFYSNPVVLPKLKTSKKVMGIKQNDEKKVAIVTIADLHIGKLCWGQETGSNYDLKIVEKIFNHTIDEQILRIQALDNVEKIIFYWSQDFLHYDGPNVETTAGTRQDSDVRWQKMYSKGIELLMSAINKLSLIAPVTTFWIESNHDGVLSYTLNAALNAHFKVRTLEGSHPVTVIESPERRKYFQYGINAFGFGHGDKEGQRIEHMMQIEAPNIWGETKERTFFLGHFHSKRVKNISTAESAGVKIIYLSSPTATDAWHNASGWLGAIPATSLFIYGKETGLYAEYQIPAWQFHQPEEDAPQIKQYQL